MSRDRATRTEVSFSEFTKSSVADRLKGDGHRGERDMPPAVSESCVAVIEFGIIRVECDSLAQQTQELLGGALLSSAASTRDTASRLALTRLFSTRLPSWLVDSLQPKLVGPLHHLCLADSDGKLVLARLLSLLVVCIQLAVSEIEGAVEISPCTGIRRRNKGMGVY